MSTTWPLNKSACDEIYYKNNNGSIAMPLFAFQILVKPPIINNINIIIKLVMYS